MEKYKEEELLKKIDDLEANIQYIKNEFVIGALKNAKTLTKMWNEHLMMKSEPEIVLCKDCINFYNNHLCLHWSKHGSIETKPDDYCSYGERL